MKYHQLRAFVAAADRGGIHAASRQLCLSQPAVSKAIRELEEDVGFALLLRRSHGVSLTYEGQVLLERARSIVLEMGRAEEELAILRGKSAGRLVIGLTPLAGLTILPDAFERFRRVMPETELNFIEYTGDKIYENLKNGTLDFAVGALNERQVRGHALNTELFSLPTSFAVRRGSPLAGCRSFAELQQAEWLHSDLGTEFESFLADIFISQGLEPPRRITRCTSQALFYSLAVKQDVVILWSLFSIGLPGLREQLQVLQLDYLLPSLKLNLIVREDAPLNRAAELFIRCIHEVAAEAWMAATDSV